MKTDYRLLVVEENIEVHKTLCRALGPIFSVIDVAHGPDAALQLLRHVSYEVITTNLAQPADMGGYVRALRHLAPASIVVLITGSGVTRQEADAWDIDFLLEKPFDLAELLQTLQQAITRYREITEGRRV